MFMGKNLIGVEDVRAFLKREKNLDVLFLEYAATKLPQIKSAIEKEIREGISNWVNMHDLIANKNAAPEGLKEVFFERMHRVISGVPDWASYHHARKLYEELDDQGRELLIAEVKKGIGKLNLQSEDDYHRPHLESWEYYSRGVPAIHDLVVARQKELSTANDSAASENVFSLDDLESVVKILSQEERERESPAEHRLRNLLAKQLPQMTLADFPRLQELCRPINGLCRDMIIERMVEIILGVPDEQIGALIEASFSASSEPCILGPAYKHRIKAFLRQLGGLDAVWQHRSESRWANHSAYGEAVIRVTREIVEKMEIGKFDDLPETIAKWVKKGFPYYLGETEYLIRQKLSQLA
jgi:hypothetical protein